MRFARYLAAAWQHATTLLTQWWNEPDDPDDGRWVHELIESPQRAVNAQLRRLLADLGGDPMTTRLGPAEAVLADLELWIAIARENLERATVAADREGLDVPTEVRAMPSQLAAWSGGLEVLESRAV